MKDEQTEDVSVHGYSVSVVWDDSEACYIARCAEIPACIGTDKDMNAAVQQAYWALVDHLRYRKELGLPAPKGLAEIN